MALLHPRLFCLACGTVLFGQASGTVTAQLEGQVAGSPKGAAVTLWQTATGRSWQVAVEDGAFTLRFLPPGLYRLRASAPGCQDVDVAGLSLHPGTVHRVKVVLKATHAVEVTARPEEVLGGGTSGAVVVDADQMAQLPLGRRDFADLSLTTPWVVPGRGPSNPGSPDSRLSFSGASPRENSFLVDGLDHNDHGGGQLRAPLPHDAIQEFQVVGAAQGAALGRFLGGVVNAVTRSGGNQATGSLSLWERPDDWEANAPGGPTGAVSSLRQMGGHAAGPILKDRLFYCVAAESLRQEDRRQLRWSADTLAAVQAAGGWVGRTQASTLERVDSVSVKLDWLAAADHALALHVVQARERSDAQIPWGGLTAEGAGGRQDTRTWTAALTHRWAAAPGWMVEGRLLRTSRSSELVSLDPTGGVQVELQGAAIFGTNRLVPQETRADYTQGILTATGSLGAHVLSFGVDALETDNRANLRQNHAGYYLFVALPPIPGLLPGGAATSLDAFRKPNPFGGTGLPGAFMQAFGDPFQHFSSGNQSAYLEDLWTRGPLSVRMGLRLDRERLPRFRDSVDVQALAAGSADVDPVMGPVRLPDGETAFSQNFQAQLDWSSVRLSPRVEVQWRATDQLRLSAFHGLVRGRMPLGPVLGIRAADGEGGFGLLRTIMDSPFSSPLITWANGDGLAQNHRYAVPPPGQRVVVLPGNHEPATLYQDHVGLTWTPRAEWTWSLEGLRILGRNLLSLHDVNPYLPMGGGFRRPDLRYASVFRLDSGSRSQHDAWTLGTQWAPRRGVSLRATYTWRRSLDDVLDWTGVVTPQDPLRPREEWGPGNDDRRHAFQVACTWTAPEDAPALWRGWSLAAIVRATSGRPYTRLLGYDANGNGDGASDRPAGVGRNGERLPWERRLDLRLARSMKWGPVRAEALLDVFNALNEATVASVQNSLASTTPVFGTPLTYEPMRQVQLGLRLGF